MVLVLESYREIRFLQVQQLGQVQQEKEQRLNMEQILINYHNGASPTLEVTDKGD